MHHNNKLRLGRVIALAFVAALFFLSAYVIPSHTADVADRNTEAAHLADGVLDAAHAQQAHSDMEVYASLYFGNFTEVPDTFGGTRWSDRWDLHWLQIEHDGHTSWLYHLTDRHDNNHRLLSVSDDHGDTWTGWSNLR